VKVALNLSKVNKKGGISSSKQLAASLKKNFTESSYM
jgi:hypothetical protein